MNLWNSFSLLYRFIFVAFEIRSQCITLMCNRQAQVTHQKSCPVNIAFLYLLYQEIKFSTVLHKIESHHPSLTIYFTKIVHRIVCLNQKIDYFIYCTVSCFFYLDFITDNRFIMLNVVLLWLIMTVWQCTNRHLTKDSTLLSERTIDHCVE